MPLDVLRLEEIRTTASTEIMAQPDSVGTDFWDSQITPSSSDPWPLGLPEIRVPIDPFGQVLGAGL